MDASAQRTELSAADQATLVSYEPVLRAEISRLCPASLRSGVDDLVQGGLIRLTRTLGRKQQINKAYVKRVAWSVTVDAIRQARRTADQPTPAGTDALDRVAGGRSPEERASLSELRNALRDCMEALSTIRKNTITMYLMGHTIRESGERLGLTNKQADNNIYRGLADLRDCLRGKGVQP